MFPIEQIIYATADESNQQKGAIGMIFFFWMNLLLGN